MPWREVSKMDERREFVRLALQEGVNRRELCRRFGFILTLATSGLGGGVRATKQLAERTRRPHGSPARTRRRWKRPFFRCGMRIRPGGRARLPAGWNATAWPCRRSRPCMRFCAVTAVSFRHPVERQRGSASRGLHRMFCGRWTSRAGSGLAMAQRCHPLTIVDDHSRYVPCLKACANQQTDTVQAHLAATFGRYGLPDAMFVDNGSPGAMPPASTGPARVWLLKLGVEVIYSRPYHPQSRGKNERFHRTLKDEVFALRRFRICPGAARLRCLARGL